LAWDPQVEFKTILSECFVKIYNHRTSEEYLSHEKADDGLEQHHRDEIHQYNIVEQVISPYMKYVLRERPNDCDTFGCAQIVLTTRKQTRGYVYELVKHMISEVKKMPNGFKTYFTIQKQTLIPLFDKAMEEKRTKKREAMLDEISMFAKKLSDKLRFSLNGQRERNVLIQFLADGLMFALGNRDDSHYISVLQPYLSLLQTTDANRLVNLINETCQAKDLQDPWVNDKQYAKKHKRYIKFCEYLKKKTEIEINIQQEYKGEASVPDSPVSIRDAAIEEKEEKNDMEVDDDYDYNQNKKTTDPDVSASHKSSNLKKRKYSRGNAVTGLSEDEVFSDLSSSGMSSDDDDDIDDNSEDDFEETPSVTNKKSTSDIESDGDDGNISENSSNNGSSNGNLSDVSQSSADNRGRVMRGLRRRSKARSRRSAPRHQQSEASIDEIDEESEISSDDSENDFEISSQSSKRQRIN